MSSEIKRNYLNGAEALVKLLDLHKVEHIFGLCGDTSLPFYDALQRLNHNIKHLLDVLELPMNRKEKGLRYSKW